MTPAACRSTTLQISEMRQDPVKFRFTSLKTFEIWAVAVDVLQDWNAAEKKIRRNHPDERGRKGPNVVTGTVPCIFDDHLLRINFQPNYPILCRIVGVFLFNFVVVVEVEVEVEVVTKTRPDQESLLVRARARARARHATTIQTSQRTLCLSTELFPRTRPQGRWCLRCDKRSRFRTPRCPIYGPSSMQPALRSILQRQDGRPPLIPWCLSSTRPHIFWVTSNIATTTHFPGRHDRSQTSSQDI